MSVAEPQAVEATGEARSQIRGHQPLIHLTNPSLPPVGNDIASWAKKQDRALEHVIRRCLYGQGGYMMPFSINAAGDAKLLQVVSGHLWYPNPQQVTRGPERADVMIIGKWLNDQDLAAQRVYAGDLGNVLLNSLRGAGWTDSEITKVYITTVLKTEPPDWGKATLPRLWVDSQLHLLWQEILLVRPKFVLLQGADAVKAVLGKRATLKQAEAEFIKIPVDYAVNFGDPPELAEIQFTASVSPAAVLHDRQRPGESSKYRTHVEQRFERQLRTFREVAIGGGELGDGLATIDVDVIDNLEDLRQALQKMRDGCQDRLVAWDGEWQGAHPQNPGSYLRCLQFAYRDDHSVVIALTHPGGQPRFTHVVETEDGPVVTTEGAMAAAMALCKEYMRGLRVVGHYFVADLEWLVYHGLDLREEYDAAKKPSGIHKGEGGLATELMAHAWDETAKFGLDEQISAHLNIPAYWAPLDQHKKAAKDTQNTLFSTQKAVYTAAVKELRVARKHVAKSRWRRNKATGGWIDNLDAMRAAELKLVRARHTFVKQQWDHEERLRELQCGYGWIPDELLYTYGAWDAVAELQLGKMYLERLKTDRLGNDCTKAYWISHRAALAVLEINSTGVPVDRDKVDYFSELFANKRDLLLAEIREVMRWPSFNPRSRFEFAEALFGEQYNGYFQQYGKRKRIRPPGAFTLRAVPLRTTGRYPMEWDEAVKKTNNTCTPSTGKQTLGEMFYAGEKLRVYRKVKHDWVIREEDNSRLIGLLRDFRFLDQALKSLIREPVKDSEDSLVKDDDGWNDYDSGVVHMICGDGRVRTRVRQTVETGRWASYDPNLTNLSKSREKDYRRILGSKFSSSIRTIFVADPGWFLVEADYSGAELMMAAIQAGDFRMIDHCRRNVLDDNDPEFYDIHSTLTVKAFRLSCEPTKHGLEGLGKVHLRTVAKSVLFGLMYGRSARAIAIAVRQEGVYITEEEAAAMIEAVFEEYPQLEIFLDNCRNRVDDGWMRNMFGRLRRFPYTKDEQKRKAFGREAMNAPMQGGVADAMSIASRNIIDYRDRMQMRYKLSLQIHDALILHVPADELLHVVDPLDGVFKRCMVDAVPLRQTDLAGHRTDNDEIYRFGIGIDIYGGWGDVPDPARFLDYGLDPAIADWKRDDTDPTRWLHGSKRGVYWSQERRNFYSIEA